MVSWPLTLLYKDFERFVAHDVLVQEFTTNDRQLFLTFLKRQVMRAPSDRSLHYLCLRVVCVSVVSVCVCVCLHGWCVRVCVCVCAFLCGSV